MEVFTMKRSVATLTRQYLFLLHGIMLFTILATVMMFVYPKIVYPLYTIGASSGLIAFGVGSALTTPYFMGLAAFIWFILFSVILIISYILGIRKRYVPFCVVITLDLLVVILWMVYARTTGNLYGFQQFIPDLIVSFVLWVLLIWTTVLLKRKKNGSAEDVLKV